MLGGVAKGVTKLGGKTVTAHQPIGASECAWWCKHKSAVALAASHAYACARLSLLLRLVRGHLCAGNQRDHTAQLWGWTPHKLAALVLSNPCRGLFCHALPTCNVVVSVTQSRLFKVVSFITVFKNSRKGLLSLIVTLFHHCDSLIESPCHCHSLSRCHAEAYVQGWFPHNWLARALSDPCPLPLCGCGPACPSLIT